MRYKFKLFKKTKQKQNKKNKQKKWVCARKLSVNVYQKKNKIKKQK